MNENQATGPYLARLYNDTDDTVPYKPLDELHANLVLRERHSTDKSWIASVKGTLPNAIIDHHAKGGVENIVVKTDLFQLSTGIVKDVVTQLLANYVIAQPERPEAPAIFVRLGHDTYRNEEALQHFGITARIMPYEKKIDKRTKDKRKMRPKKPDKKKQ